MQTELRPSASKFTTLELAWLALAVALTAGGLCAVALAQTCLFTGWGLLLAGLIALALGWLFYRVQREYWRRTRRREALFVAALLGAGLLLYSWPSEDYPLLGDSSIYTNTAEMLLRTGGLSYHYGPLDGLTQGQKELFYIPSDVQLPNIAIGSYQGVVYGAYYVMDPGQNSIVSSRPPLTTAWMGLLGMVFGARGMLYVTPIFGAASLVTLYFLGKRTISAPAGALAALWLLVSFPQLHFSRAPYAEAVAQFFVLAFLYSLVAYWQTRRLALLPLGIAAWTAAFAARIDAILALPTLLLFAGLLVARRDGKGLAWILAGAVGAAVYTLWTVNRPYVGATAELMLSGQLSFLQRWMPYLILLGLGSLLFLGLLLFLARRISLPWLSGAIRWGLSLAVILGLGYALYIRPLTPEYVYLAGQAIPTHSEELLDVAARYISPVLVWLAAFGVILVLQRRPLRLEQVLLLAFVTSFGAVFFWKYTTARVYPVALRRLMPEVVPGLALFGASAVYWLGRPPRLRGLATALAGLTAALLLTVSAPYWFHVGGRGALDTLKALSEQIPSGGVALFEPQQDDAVVSWFAAPLWSFYQRDALLLNSGELDGTQLREAICYWQRQGREVYVVTQHDPSTWWPGQLAGHRESGTSWNSSMIGESLRFPPYVWRFDFTFSIYQLDGPSCSPS